MSMQLNPLDAVKPSDLGEDVEPNPLADVQMGAHLYIWL
jgi:hypothetical protein